MDQSEESSNKLYVGNLPYGVTNDSLKDMFVSFGEVVEAVVITDKFSGRSKGFGFITMDNVDNAGKAAEDMNGKEVEGRNIVVNFARPMKKKFDR